MLRTEKAGGQAVESPVDLALIDIVDAAASAQAMLRAMWLSFLKASDSNDRVSDDDADAIRRCYESISDDLTTIRGDAQRAGRRPATEAADSIPVRFRRKVP